ncbi:ferredoxin [Piromyces finnis]|uniref:Ferredoxin n=1 Tax=Piromyces finnis TaxID=1754191 RepID=A0A1Y1UXY3_9FUNG|nr:ferredoxin [Piromyces finnis]|eukprot:ORX43236.1 ferredoxin [Piromyces finnis]
MSLSNILKATTGISLNSRNFFNKLNVPLRNSINFQPEIQNFNKIQLAKFSKSSILKLYDGLNLISFIIINKILILFYLFLKFSKFEYRYNRNKNGINITFITDGKKKTVQAKRGESLLDVTRENDIFLEGACEGSCACSTCHVIIDPEFYEKIEEPSEGEEDLLELAFGLTDTSRLGCQVRVTKAMDGMTVTIPSVTRNMAVDG